MKRNLTIVAVLAALAAAGWFAWGYFVANAVTVAEARTGRAVEAVYATAVIEPVFWGRVGPTSVGRIAEIKAKEGETVRRDQELGRLDDETARARLRELDARINQLRADVARLRPLARSGYASQQSFERAESDLKQAVAQRAAQAHVLDDLVLRAPMDGVVLRRDGEVGETVGPERILYWVGKPRPLRAEAEVDEEDIPRVRVGQAALIKSDAFPGRVLEGKVAEITPKGDPVSKSYRVRIGLPDDTPLLVGMTIETNIVVRVTEDAVLVPISAVPARAAMPPVSGSAASGAAGGGNGFMWTVVDGKARRVAVRLGVRAPETVEVRSGLAAGARVILSPPAGLRDGARVRVK